VAPTIGLSLVGGGTGLIGDPSGKSAERTLLTADKAAESAGNPQKALALFRSVDA
jgi:tyrosyl-tRNA synthetase